MILLSKRWDWDEEDLIDDPEGANGQARFEYSLSQIRYTMDEEGMAQYHSNKDPNSIVKQTDVISNSHKLNHNHSIFLTKYALPLPLHRNPGNCSYL